MLQRFPCADSACVWQLTEGELFCGLCGRAGAELELHPAEVRDGIVFYPRDEKDDVQVIWLAATGNVTLPVRLRIGPNFQMAGSDGAWNASLELRLSPEPESRVRVILRRDTTMPVARNTLFVETRTGTLEIPVISSDVPKWRLSYETAGVPPGRTLSLLPKPGQRPTWTLAVGPTRGAAIVTAISAVDGGDTVQVIPTTRLPKLLRHHEVAEFELQWCGPAASPARKVQLQLTSRRGDEATFDLKVHPRQPVALGHRVLEPAGARELFFGGGSAQYITIDLQNKGAGLAQLDEVRPLLEGVRLEMIRLVPAAEPDDPGGREDMEPSGGGGLLPEVREAFIPGPAEAGSRVEGDIAEDAMLVRLLRFEVAPHVRPTADGLQFEVEFHARAGDHRYTVRRTISVLAREIEPTEHTLLIDYGTVHTCAAVDPQLEGFPDRLVPLSTPAEVAEGDHPYEFRSTYRVVDWLSTELAFGREAWLKMAQSLSSTDFAAKLRLGTRHKRALRDEGVVVRQVSGIDAAGHLLREVIRRVHDRTGYEFSRVQMTHPAAFDAASTQELRDVLVDLGFPDDEEHIHFPCSEPEAYLNWLVGDGDRLGPMTDRYRAKKRARGEGVLGIVFDFGGGTTDVTVFKFTAKLGPELQVLCSHGYRWLGGERITELMAAALLRTIDDYERFPFPKIHEREGIRPEQLDPSRIAEQFNYGQLRDKAERAKCHPKERGADFVELMTAAGSLPELVEYHRQDEDKAGRPGLRPVVERLVSDAIDDILDRLQQMDTHGVIDDFAPEVVAVAGNSGRLWCLKEIIMGKLKKKSAQEPPLYSFHSENAKTGVLLGLASFSDAAKKVEVGSRTPLLARWWFVRVHGQYHLGLPAGVRLYESKPAEHLISVGEGLARLKGALEIASGPGPGPNNRVGIDETAKHGLAVRGRVELPPEADGEWCDIRMGCRDRQLGLFIRIHDLDEEDEVVPIGDWLWSALEGVEPEVTPVLGGGGR